MGPDAITLAGQVAVITGAGRGLGRAYALELARRGAAVVVNDLAYNPEYGEHDQPAVSVADAVVNSIVGSGGTAVAALGSGSTPDGAQAIIDAALNRFGRIDILIHNAGNRRNGRLEDLTTEMIDSVLDVHLRAAFWLAKPAWVAMQRQRYGRIVLTSSTVGAFGMVGLTNYTAAKAGLIGLTKSLALEGEQHGIAVNCVLPTAHTEARSGTPDGRRHVSGIADRVRAAKPTGELGRSELVAALVAYLASSKCSVTGRVMWSAGGIYGEAFMGSTLGWVSSGDAAVCAEDVRRHLREIEDRHDYRVPTSALDELEAVAATLHRTGRGSVPVPETA
jgi:NAD(P)-dependent dehydrogenase (short-subunit alcohol dehydrogenase family)